MTALAIHSDDGSKCLIRGCRHTEDANEIGYSIVLAERIDLPLTLLTSTQDAGVLSTFSRFGGGTPG